MYKILFAVLSCVVVQSHAMQPQKICHSCTPFEKKGIAIAKSKLFYASLDPRDNRVPRVFVQTHDHIACLSDWTAEHWQEFGLVEKALETALKTSFECDLVNVGLMNLADGNPHTHWHFIARLRDKITFFDPINSDQHILEDPCYGKAYDMNAKNYRKASPKIMAAIIRAIQENLDVSTLPEGALKKELDTTNC
jgi:diadenosine tetraphosphate (Ap4A) HIT family hydrolase